MEATLDRFGRIVIPKKIREDFHLHVGSSIRIEEGEGEIVLKPVEGEPSLVKKGGVLVYAGKAGSPGGVWRRKGYCRGRV